MYILRLDDAAEYMDEAKWKRMEQLLDRYGVKPIFGVIPHSEDPDLLAYGKVEGFWEWMRQWISKEWTPALHGYTHVFETNEGGLNPVNTRSEFAGVPYERQCEKIRSGYETLKANNIIPEIFFAPAHTFDENTLKALAQETPIRIISDTVANDVYFEKGFYFIPQQSGHVRKLPFKTVTFCYHPNIMTDAHFEELEQFLKENAARFVSVRQLNLKSRKKSILDKVLSWLYFLRR